MEQFNLCEFHNVYQAFKRITYYLQRFAGLLRSLYDIITDNRLKRRSERRQMNLVFVPVDLRVVSDLCASMHYLLLIMFLLLLQYTHLLMFGLILQGVLP